MWATILLLVLIRASTERPRGVLLRFLPEARLPSSGPRALLASRQERQLTVQSYQIGPTSPSGLARFRPSPQAPLPRGGTVRAAGLAHPQKPRVGPCSGFGLRY